VNSDTIFKSNENSVFVVNRDGDIGGSMAPPGLMHRMEEYSDYLDSDSSVYFSKIDASRTSYLEGKEKLLKVSKRAAEFRKDTREALGSIVIWDAADESDLDLPEFLDFQLNCLKELAYGVEQNPVYQPNVRDEGEIYSIYVIGLGPSDMTTNVLGRVIDYVQELKDILHETEKIWELFQKSIKRIRLGLKRVAKALEKRYFPRFVGKGIEGFITYQTWARPPTIGGSNDSILDFSRIRASQV
jgi:hypothetical protein